MKIKNYFVIILLIIIYILIVKQKTFFKPFYYLKDLLFYRVKAISNIDLSNSFETSIINNLKNDLEEIEKLNNISLSLSDFEMINATVISRNRDYWFNTLTINRGEDDGIIPDMAVVDSNGLIGRISMVTAKTSLVKLITTSDVKNRISAVIHNKEGDIYALISGYDSVNNLLQLIITDNANIDANSKVETTGMGGVFPSGILIGYVKDVIKKDDGVTNVVRVKPSSNIKGEKYVSVLKRREISIN